MFRFKKKPIENRPAKPESVRNETRIGSTVTIRGNLSGRGNVIISGTVIGDCTIDGSITLDRSGNLDGCVKGKRVEIDGRLKGALDAPGMAVLKASAQVEAEVKTASLTVAEGACLNGRIEINFQKASAARRA